MTGRRLYELACDARKNNPANQYVEGPSHLVAAPWVAWPFLLSNERHFWNELARRVTPKRRRP